MRQLFFALVLVNLGFAAWSAWFAPLNRVGHQNRRRFAEHHAVERSAGRSCGARAPLSSPSRRRPMSSRHRPRPRSIRRPCSAPSSQSRSPRRLPVPSRKAAISRARRRARASGRFVSYRRPRMPLRLCAPRAISPRSAWPRAISGSATGCTSKRFRPSGSERDPGQSARAGHRRFVRDPEQRHRQPRVARRVQRDQRSQPASRPSPRARPRATSRRSHSPRDRVLGRRELAPRPSARLRCTAAAGPHHSARAACLRAAGGVAREPRFLKRNSLCPFGLSAKVYLHSFENLEE